MNDADIRAADRLMRAFARTTGLVGEGPPRRYLWTDAHAVCNFLTLRAATGDSSHGQLALRLVDQVHEVLGRHRGDDGRTGWLSGLDDVEARRHPTAGGLRIGKPLPERTAGPPDDDTEWDRDGQYYHYLTKWMHALRQVAIASGEGRYLAWARELASTAYHRFRAESGVPRLYWKMSIDLSRPQVPAAGLHDPLDGLITALSLRQVAHGPVDVVLDDVVTGLARRCGRGDWATSDPLGIGGLLFDAGRLAQLQRPIQDVDTDSLLRRLLDAANRGLAEFGNAIGWRQPGAYRLAFRELGLCIGLRALGSVQHAGWSGETARLLDAVGHHAALADSLTQFWTDSDQQRTATWIAHRDINTVMLATSLAPGAFVEL